MRDRFDSQGNLIGAHNMIFDDIPDDYEIQKFILEQGVYDLSYLGVMKYLRNQNVSAEFHDNQFYSKQVLEYLALDYLQSALFLQKEIIYERGIDIVSYYLIPCAFLCRHAVELKIKECLLEKTQKIVQSHNVLKLWESLNEKDLNQYHQLDFFVHELEYLDQNEMALRYGVSVNLEPLKEDFMFDIDAMLNNAKFFFNVVDEYIICKYRYQGE